MRYIKIRFFPADKIDYTSHYFLIFIFYNIYHKYIAHEIRLFKSNNKPVYTLLIPNTDGTFEENKDLNFSRLSINDRIISVKK